MFIARYWIAVAVLLFALLSAYTSSPMYGQSTQPTPDVNTVPSIELFQTPTNTPFPTPTPMDDDNQGGGGALPPTATPVPNNNSSGDAGNNDDNDASRQESNSGDSSTSTNNAENGNTNTDAVAEQNNNQLTGVVNVVTLNIRRGPSTDDPIIDTIFINEPVSILSRDNNDSWWYVCCGSGSGREGWVSAQFITPNFVRTEATTLLPISATTAQALQDEETDNILVVEMRPSPAFAWQGQTVRLQYTIRNLSDQRQTNIRLRNDLPPSLIYIDAAAEQGGRIQVVGEAEDGLVYTINWPALDAGASATATVTLQLANNIPNGAMVDNLAVVESAEGATSLAGITFAMPPLRLPRFR